MSKIHTESNDLIEFRTEILSNTLSPFPRVKQENEQKSPKSLRQYTINLAWVNKAIQSNQKTIYVERFSETTEKKIINPVESWARKNPDVPIYLWYDSKTVPHDAVQNTEDLLPKDIKNIKLKDYRELELVKEYPEVFAQNNPLAFYVDLLRVIAAYEAVLKNKDLTYVHADLDIPALDQEKLFDQETNTYLNRYGIVMSRSGVDGYENSFMMLQHNSEMLQAIKHTIIDLNLNRIKILKNNIEYLSLLEQKVFHSFKKTLIYYLYLTKKLNLLIVDPYNEKKYSYGDSSISFGEYKHYAKEFHPFIPFKLVLYSSVSIELDTNSLDLSTKEELIQLNIVNHPFLLEEEYKERRDKCIDSLIPTKDVHAPLAKLKYSAWDET